MADYFVSSGVTSSGMILKESDIMSVLSGGTANSTTVNYGGYLGVSSGGTANDTTVNSNGHFEIYDGGLVRNTTVNSYGWMNVSSGGTAAGTTVYSGGFMFVSSGGTATGTTLNSRGVTSVLFGGTANSATVNSGGHLLVMFGGSANDTTVNEGGTLFVVSGGTASDTTFNSKGSLILSSGKLTGKMRFESDMTMDVATGSILDFDLTQTAPDADSLVYNRSSLLLNKQFTCTLTVDGTEADGKYNLMDGAAGFNKTITIVNTLGESIGTLTAGGGTKTIGKKKYTLSLDEAELSVTVVRIPDMTGDLTSSASLTSGMYASGLIVSGRTMKRASLLVSSGGFASMTTVIRSSFLDVSSGGMVDNTTVSSGGTMTVFSGGVANHTSVFSSGSMYISSGGSVSDITVLFIGTVNISEGVAVDTVTVSTGGLVNVYGGSVSNATISSGGRMWVGRGSATDTMVSSKGLMSIGSGCEVRNTTVSAGSMFVRSGASASRTTVSGSVIVSGTATDNTVYFNGCLDICNGGLASNTTIKYYGISYVSSGGTAADVTVENDGDLFVLDGGKVTGKITLKNDAGFYLTTGSILDFDISGVGPENDPFVNDFSLVQYAATDMSMPVTPTYTLTVSGTQANGKYKLAGGAAGFDKTISVVNTSGTELGTLSLAGGTQTIGGVDYTLNLGGDNVLSVTVGAAALTGPAKSDIDGNGISDVMFVWTGEHGEGNYQHGYWMNGTNEWQSANSSHPAEWDNLGCHDMTGDGKADSVLFGNVTSEAGVHGAYIGYYADANDLPDGSTWVNIGYLTNEDNIDWKNVVGNLTGNASGVNSIVWYAPELYALGVWTDGTENWVTLSTTFGGSAWTLVGCGDFTGDGKDQVVMALNGGELYYEVGIDGTSSELTKSDSGWEIRAIGDFSGDGRDDIVAFHKETGLVAMWGDGDAANKWSKLGQLDANDWFVVGCGDYDADAKDDLLVRQYSTGMLGYYSSGDMGSWTELGRGVDMNWTVIA